MAYDARFGPSAQTPEQWALVLVQMLVQAALPSLQTNLSDFSRQLYARYVAGELSWLDVHALRYPTPYA